ncbi:MAG: hypothetical protein H0X66_20015 [Verrucomicrobia bacterium]|nr:hypothetical protein [Verrucomicrobiota bacterium]
MITTIFESETEIGKCRCDSEDGERWRFAEPDYATIFAHTAATVNGHRGMLRIEQHCYLRRGGELPDQPWIKPEVLLEPTLGSRETLIEMAEQLHTRFISRVREEFPEQYMV